MSFRNFLATGEQSILLPLSPAAGLPEVRTAPKDLESALHPGAADAAYIQHSVGVVIPKFVADDGKGICRGIFIPRQIQIADKASQSFFAAAKKEI